MLNNVLKLEKSRGKDWLYLILAALGYERVKFSKMALIRDEPWLPKVVDLP